MSLRRSAIVLGMLGFSAAVCPAAAQERGTLGFVISDWSTSVYNTKFADECPEGLATANDEYFVRGLSKEARVQATHGGFLQAENRMDAAMHRGPGDLNVCINPTVVKDPVMRIVEGKYSYGDNLDGTKDGQATPKSCAHQKFISPLDGKTAVDNQMYRLVGCTYGWRHTGGMVDANANEMRHSSGLGMILIEITGVNDPRNSDNVTVTFYRSIDQYAFDGAGAPLPFTSYRIETVAGKPMYGDSIKGSIKDGVLTTVRGDVRLPYYGNYNFLHPVIKDFGLKFEIAEDGKSAKGQITGYYDLDEFLYYEQGIVGHSIAGDDCPAWYEMGHKLADGYPDPKTGACTALSSAFDIAASAAFIVHPKGAKQMRTSQR